VKAAPDATRPLLKKLLAETRKLLPNAEESITYGIPTFKLSGERVIYLAAFVQHCSVFPIGDALRKKLPEVKPFVSGRGTLKLHPDRPLPPGLLKKIVSELRAAATQRLAAKAKKRSSRSR
jgi:uncharacterized protein YdhG (YjbR/CyaY superfamily)